MMNSLTGETHANASGTPSGDDFCGDVPQLDEGVEPEVARALQEAIHGDPFSSTGAGRKMLRV